MKNYGLFKIISSGLIFFADGTPKIKLWFILNKNNPEGLIFTNEQEPIRMGGEKRSKDLYEIYKSIQTNVKQIKKIIYIEFEGQGLFVVCHENGEEVYASEGASFILVLLYKLTRPKNQKMMNSSKNNQL
ncbi:hypothetical protein ACT4UT_32220, partial [Bacillus sp. B-TM1]